MEDLFAAIQDAGREFDVVYRPLLESKRKVKEQQEATKQRQTLERIQKDIQSEAAKTEAASRASPAASASAAAPKTPSATPSPITAAAAAKPTAPAAKPSTTPAQSTSKISSASSSSTTPSPAADSNTKSLPKPKSVPVSSVATSELGAGKRVVYGQMEAQSADDEELVDMDGNQDSAIPELDDGKPITNEDIKKLAAQYDDPEEGTVLSILLCLQEGRRASWLIPLFFFGTAAAEQAAFEEFMRARKK
jgi:hypothetical protein